MSVWLLFIWLQVLWLPVCYDRGTRASTVKEARRGTIASHLLVPVFICVYI